ncbi:MAG TPA: formate dehydrogenase subunit beta [Planctomycetota bacterium]|nr:formate dehydrogenase subunit beta [Planctomycetota bacterium]
MIGLEVKRVSATGARTTVKDAEPLAMLIDTTTCIGCKACEVACVEWNDLKVEPETGARMLQSFQSLPDMTPSFWNLIRFDEIHVDAERRPLEAAVDGAGLMMLMRKDMCMHCAEPGCMVACPAEGAIVQYANGIVDFQSEHCIGCGYCMTGCPFNVPKFDPATQRVNKCTMCSDRLSNGLGPACVKACPTGCLEFGQKDEMLARAERRAAQVRESGFAQAGVYDPPGVGGTGVVYVLHHADRPELYGGLPREPKIDPQVRFWKGPLKVLGGAAFGLSLVAAALHYLVAGPRKERAHAAPAAAPPREVVRYTLAERILHWTVAFSFVYLSLTGLGLFSPKLAWLLPVFGGGQIVRAWHPIAGCVFSGAVLVLFGKWFRDLRVTGKDLVWLRSMRDYLAGRDDRVPPSGRFNAGQKLLFWTQVVLGVVLLATGIPVWFPESFGRGLRLWCLVLHSAAGAAAMLSLVAHIYMAVFVTRGALRAMTEGRVSEDWARHHHGAWADEMLGQSPVVHGPPAPAAKPERQNGAGA